MSKKKDTIDPICAALRTPLFNYAPADYQAIEALPSSDASIQGLYVTKVNADVKRWLEQLNIELSTREPHLMSDTEESDWYGESIDRRKPFFMPQDGALQTTTHSVIAISETNDILGFCQWEMHWEYAPFRYKQNRVMLGVSLIELVAATESVVEQIFSVFAETVAAVMAKEFRLVNGRIPPSAKQQPTRVMVLFHEEDESNFAVKFVPMCRANFEALKNATNWAEYALVPADVL